ncbi:hypothetical protein [Hyphococcus sp.]|jgi:hypothetical protein|uniref:hypothetical protein n=1 Tax=Hyphococcus sp. TaxID=2038636 RepID=UPI003D0B0925
MTENSHAVAEDRQEFGDDFPEAPPPASRKLPVATIAIILGLAALILLLVLSY